MYLWIACDTERELASIRSLCREQNRRIGLSEVAFSLPQHVSLKISFPVSDTQVEAVITRLEQIVQEAPPLLLQPKAIERQGEVLWLAFEPTAALVELHRELDEVMERDFGVLPHPYDLDFRFHSTLFLDADTERLMRMERLLSNLTLPPPFPVNRFFIGCSPSGRAGEYTICKRI